MGITEIQSYLPSEVTDSVYGVITIIYYNMVYLFHAILQSSRNTM
jgi:hypothetical protein